MCRSILNSLLLLTLLPILAHTTDKPFQKLTPVPFDQVKIQDEFWQPKIIANHKVTVPHNLYWCEKTGRISNFAKAAGLMEGDFEGIYFNDSDVYKVLEGASYDLALHPDPEIERHVDEIIAKIAAAQQDNGYLNTYYTLVEPDKRWTNLRVRHELYCAGHLIEAAVAHYKATGKRTLLDVAIKFADLIDSIFGPDKRRDVPGHEELELALVKLYHLTGEKRYLDLAQFFIDERGHPHDRDLYGKSLQDHLPVREQSEVHGHAVRAMYLFSGVADVAAITGDQGYFEAMDRIWNDLVSHKMYITGGIGVSGHGEGFSGGYDLPNANAYAETCASIALAFFNHRLNLLHADSRYADVFERVLYNGLLSGVSRDGDKFFYRNPLKSFGPEAFSTSGGKQGGSIRHRQHWFSCACCPTNVVRFIPKIGEYIYAHYNNQLYVNLYIASETEIPFADTTLNLAQDTRYPWDGHITLNIDPATPTEFDVLLRIPSWSEEHTIRINGYKTDYQIKNGYARLNRKWRSGDDVELHLPMPIKRIKAHPLVTADRGRVALQRGPLVYCLEQVDNEVSVHQIALPPDAQLKAVHKPYLLGGLTIIQGEGITPDLTNWQGKLYGTTPKAKPVKFTAIPYYAWDNRKPDDMTVWLPEHPDFLPLPTIAYSAEPSASHIRDNIRALNDQQKPASSDDNTIPRFTWWDHKGTEEWVQYDFDEPQTLSSASVYWFDDEGKGKCRVPNSWKLLYKEGGGWKEVENPSDYGVEKDKFNRVTFDPIKTQSLRLKVQLQDEFSGGIMEWIVLE